MDRHHNMGGEVSSGRFSKPRNSKPATAAGSAGMQRSGRMGPPAPRFNNASKNDEAQQKAAAAAKQSAAMDIFGSLGF